MAFLLDCWFFCLWGTGGGIEDNFSPQSPTKLNATASHLPVHFPHFFADWCLEDTRSQSDKNRSGIERRASFPSYDGVLWAKTESSARTTEKILFVTDTAAEQLGAPCTLRFIRAINSKNTIVDTAFNLLPVDPQGIGDLAFLPTEWFILSRRQDKSCLVRSGSRRRWLIP